jgi:predicted Zn-dependent protease
VVANSDGLCRRRAAPVALERRRARVENKSAGRRGGRVRRKPATSSTSAPEMVAGAAATAVSPCRGARARAGATRSVSPGWGGVMVHECFGHSMEGDTIHKKNIDSCHADGQRVAARGVTIVDSGIVRSRLASTTRARRRSARCSSKTACSSATSGIG